MLRFNKDNAEDSPGDSSSSAYVHTRKYFICLQKLSMDDFIRAKGFKLHVGMQHKWLSSGTLRLKTIRIQSLRNRKIESELLKKP